MPEESNTITIARPVGDVFAFLANAENDKQWRGGVAEMTRTSGQGVGILYRQIDSDLAAAGLHPFPTAQRHSHQGNAPQFSACVRYATCDGFPCLVNGKADAQVICVEPALRYPNVTLLTHALFTRLETDPSGRSVTQVVVERDGNVEATRRTSWWWPPVRSTRPPYCFGRQVTLIPADWAIPPVS